MVIVDERIDRAERAGRLMARIMTEQMGATAWRMYVHLRKPDNLVGRDDGYAEYSGGSDDARFHTSP